MNLIKKRGRNKKHINLAVVVGKKNIKKLDIKHILLCLILFIYYREH